MTRLGMLTGAAALFVATPALAFHCPKDAAAIDHALGVLEVSDEVKAEAMDLRDQGMQQHEAGNHAEAVDSLTAAMRLLLTSVE